MEEILLGIILLSIPVLITYLIVLYLERKQFKVGDILVRKDSEEWDSYFMRVKAVGKNNYLTEVGESRYERTVDFHTVNCLYKKREDR
jgi:hypothetical protein